LFGRKENTNRAKGDANQKCQDFRRPIHAVVNLA
jgi:hypothetical protein